MGSRSLRSSLRKWEAGREMNVARGQAAQSRSSPILGNKDKLALGKAAAKNLIAATKKKNKADKEK